MYKEYKLNNSVTLKNRFVMAPMTTYSSNDDLTVADDEADYYAARAKEVGMVITGTTFFQPNGQGFSSQFSAADDSFIPSLKKMADVIKAGGAKAILQIFHAGRMADSTLNQPVSASSISPLYGSNANVIPQTLTEIEIHKIIEGFGKATKRAIEAGFDGVEIHGANTYLIQQFFSPHSNRREDDWGGSLEKRLKFPLAVVNSVLKAKEELKADKFIIGYRFSPEELENPGICLDDTLLLVDALANTKLDYLHISLGDYDGTSLRDKSNPELIGKLVSRTIAGRKPFIGVGNIKSAKDIEQGLKNCGYDLIAVGQPLVTDPNWLSKIKNNENPIDSIDLQNYSSIPIPLKFRDKIEGAKGWFKVK